MKGPLLGKCFQEGQGHQPEPSFKKRVLVTKISQVEMPGKPKGPCGQCAIQMETSQ